LFASGGRVGRTVVLKLKTSDFHILTRSHTPPATANEVKWNSSRSRWACASASRCQNQHGIGWSAWG